MDRYIITEGQQPTPPAGAAWWSCHAWDGEGWSTALQHGEWETGRPRRHWEPHLAQIATVAQWWGPGRYRVTWHRQDHRHKIAVAEPFTLAATTAPVSLPTDDGPEIGLSSLHLPQLPSSESPLQLFMCMYPLLRGQIDAESKRIEKQYELAIATERHRAELAIAAEQHRAAQLLHQTREWFAALERMRTEGDPRLRDLERRIQEISESEYEGEEGGNGRQLDGSTQSILQELVRGLLPVALQLVQRVAAPAAAAAAPAIGTPDAT